jgi:peptide/nickel transport system permease protein
MLDAFAARDIPVLQGTVLVVALLYVTVQLLLDLAIAGLDPRVRLR